VETNGAQGGAIVAVSDVRNALPAPNLAGVSQIETHTHKLGLIQPPPDIRYVDLVAQAVFFPCWRACACGQARRTCTLDWDVHVGLPSSKTELQHSRKGSGPCLLPASNTLEEMRQSQALSWSLLPARPSRDCRPARRGKHADELSQEFA
jgi:hypothetical protein